MDDPRTHRAARIAERDPSALQPDTPARRKQARERALAVTLDAGQADDLARSQLEIDLVEAGASQGRDIEQRRGSLTRRRLVGEGLADRPADDQPENVLLGSVGGGHGAADLAVPQDGDSVSDALHFRQPMRDVDNGLAVLRDRADAVEKAFALSPREELRRLVEYENFRLERERLGDLEQLPVRNAELADPRRWVDARPDHGELLERPRPGAHNGRPQPRWHREDHVLHDREVLEDREVLVDDGETECLCGGG